jgi:L-ornithine Nalpha-acyltransferase
MGRYLHTLEEVNRIYSYLLRKQVITDRFGVKPLDSHRIDGLKRVDEEVDDKELFRSLPPLMKGYQWLGAEIGGDPAYDETFDTVDFFIVLETDRLTKRYKKRFMTG